MRILFVSSEATPFAKSGGLADVAGGLSKALAALGHDVLLVLPRYRQIIPAEFAGESLKKSVEVPVGPGRYASFELFSTNLPAGSANVPNAAVRALLLDHPGYFDRASLYTENGADYRDNAERFIAFSRAALAAAEALDWMPEIVHSHDWQTALIPALVAIEQRPNPAWSKTATVFTIHNMAFQGRFWRWDMTLTGLDWQFFNWRQMESYGDLNLLKTGITFADQVTTVSPTYAQEICTPEYGYGLDTTLSYHRNELSGILNGVDTSEWNPATDPHLPVRYSKEKLGLGKPACKQALQEECHLPTRPEVPLAAMISRMTDQKGFDLLVQCADQLLQMELQLVFLGTGEARYAEFAQSLATRFPQQVATFIGVDEPLSHRMEAGADLFLMPSRFEPCGLNQQYSQIYGTPPVVHSVGGLADSVIDAGGPNADAVRMDGTGFVFHNYEASAFLDAVRRAVAVYHQAGLWQRLMLNGMSRDWSWAASAVAYQKVYERALLKISE